MSVPSSAGVQLKANSGDVDTRSLPLFDELCVGDLELLSSNEKVVNKKFVS